MSGWQLSVTVPKTGAAPFDAAFSQLCPAHTIRDQGSDRVFDGYLVAPPAPADVAAALGIAAAAAGIDPPEPTVTILGDTDWVSLSRQGLDAISVGRLIVRGSHIPRTKVPGKIDLLVDTAPAFGTGHHPTTYGCLQALDHLARGGTRPNRALDLGCGTGVLALAVAKLWHCPVTALDIDPTSVRIAEDNASLNRVSGIQFGVSDGIAALNRPHQTGFDLIAANILAGPLVRLASDLWRVAAPGCVVILSGLLARQDRWVVNAYRRGGFHLVERIRRGDWHSLVMRRPH